MLTRWYNRYSQLDNTGSAVVTATLSVSTGTSITQLGSQVLVSGAAAQLNMYGSADSLVVKNLTVAGGALTLKGTVQVTGSYTQTGGVVTVSNVFQATGVNNSLNGGTFTGSGLATFVNDLTLGGSTISLTRIDAQQTLTIVRSSAITGGNLNSLGSCSISGVLAGSGSATFKNSGTVVLQLGAQLSGTGWSVNNVGTIILPDNVTVALVATFTSTGSINVTNGILSVQGGGVFTGPVNVAASAILQIAGGTSQFNAGSSIVGAGSVSFIGGTSTISAIYNVLGVTTVQGGSHTLAASASITSLGSKLVVQGTGTLTVNALSVQLPDTSLLGGSLVLNTAMRFPSALNITGGTHFFNADVTIPGDLFMQAGISVKAGIRLNLAANFIMASGAVLSGSGLTTVTGTFQWQGAASVSPTSSFTLSSVMFNVFFCLCISLIMIVVIQLPGGNLGGGTIVAYNTVLSGPDSTISNSHQFNNYGYFTVSGNLTGSSAAQIRNSNNATISFITGGNFLGTSWTVVNTGALVKVNSTDTSIIAATLKYVTTHPLRQHGTSCSVPV
jgi:hypothetical protein